MIFLIQKKYILFINVEVYYSFLVHKNTGSFYLDVEKKLKQLLSNKGDLKTNSFSPYGYRLDFEILLNTSKESNNTINNEKYDNIFIALKLL